MIFENPTFFIGLSTAVAVTSVFGVTLCLYKYFGSVRYSDSDDLAVTGGMHHIRKGWNALTNGAGIGLINHHLSAKEKNRLDKLLGEAGISSKLSAADFVLVKITVGLVTGAVIIAITALMGLPVQLAIVCGVVFGLVGKILPDRWLKRRGRIRKARIIKEIPFLLDVLVLTIRAGLAPAMAMETSIDMIPNGPLKDEFKRMLNDVRGSDRKQAMQRLAQRIQLPEIGSFVGIYIQANEQGGTLTNTLVEQARLRRRKRFLTAEKRAGKAALKLLRPLMLYIFPVVLLMIGLPIARDIINSGFLS